MHFPNPYTAVFTFEKVPVVLSAVPTAMQTCPLCLCLPSQAGRVALCSKGGGGLVAELEELVA